MQFHYYETAFVKCLNVTYVFTDYALYKLSTNLQINNRYNILNVALSETRFTEKGEIIEREAGYIFLWLGQKAEEKRESGVGFAIFVIAC